MHEHEWTSDHGIRFHYSGTTYLTSINASETREASRGGSAYSNGEQDASTTTPSPNHPAYKASNTG